MTLNGAGTLAVLMFIIAILCFFGLLPGGWLVGLMFAGAGGIISAVVYLVWSDMTDV